MERTSTDGRVGVAAGVAEQRSRAVGRIAEAGCVAEERIKTNRRIIRACSEAKERISTLDRILAGIASVRCWGNRSRLRRKPKAGQRQRDEKKTEPQRRSVGRISD